MGTRSGIHRITLLWGLALTLVAGGASVASAADYHATPGGSGTICSSAAPCALPTAVGQANTAGSGRVLMAAGTYNPVGAVTVTGADDIGPEPGASTPTVHGPGSGNVFNIVNAGAVLHDVALTQLGGNVALRLLNGTAERIFVTTTAGSPACDVVDGATLRDSVCWANGSGPSASGVWVNPPNLAPSTGNVLNVTAIGGHSGVQLVADAAGEAMTLNATNVIAKGGVADVATEPSGGGATQLNLSNSAYATTSGPGSTITAPGTNGNQTATPLFANPAGGDFREAPGSPTIDAGTPAAGIGALDADRHARVQSACVGGVAIPDMGAYEVSPPTASARCSAFTIGALALSKKKGIGKLTVSVPGAGQLSATGKGLKRASVSSSAAGDLVLKLKAKGKKLKALNRSGKTKLNVSLTWAPTGNTGSTQAYKVKLKKK